MAQVFHPAFNYVAKASIIVAVLAAAGGGGALYAFFRSGYATNKDVAITQPVQFSHAHHVNGLGIDCRYCHTTVEYSNYANIPPTKTCMNCHSQIWVGSDMLAPIRESYATNKSIEWQRVHRLADFVYFDHSIHLSKGVSCYSCHGRVDHMQAVYQKGTLLMEWCLECHRNPEKHIRPREVVFELGWRPDLPIEEQRRHFTDAQIKEYGLPTTQDKLGPQLMDKYHVRNLIECSACHR